MVKGDMANFTTVKLAMVKWSMGKIDHDKREKLALVYIFIHAHSCLRAHAY